MQGQDAPVSGADRSRGDAGKGGDARQSRCECAIDHHRAGNINKDTSPVAVADATTRDHPIIGDAQRPSGDRYRSSVSGPQRSGDNSGSTDAASHDGGSAREVASVLELAKDSQMVWDMR